MEKLQSSVKERDRKFELKLKEITENSEKSLSDEIKKLTEKTVELENRSGSKVSQMENDMRNAFLELKKSYDERTVSIC